ncbi:MAG: hypothetical protein PHN32_04210 [Actinomycetota bacterium]|jgi:predicted PurR-regulated permease PerM|nr:hypothetical protein [Actinomycetota bacterium]
MARKVYVREIYFYLICVIALIVFIIGIVNLADNITNYVNPVTYSSRPQVLPMYKEQYPDMSAEQIEAMVQEEMDNSLRYEKNIALRGIIRGVLMLVISIPLFAFHWRGAQKIWASEKD